MICKCRFNGPEPSLSQAPMRALRTGMQHEERGMGHMKKKNVGIGNNKSGRRNVECGKTREQGK